MSFTSLSYMAFLPVVYVIFLVSKDRFRWIVLLIASYGFYAAFEAPQLIAMLAVVTAISYFCGISLGKTKVEHARKLIFWSGTVVCVLLLVVMKYLPAVIAANDIHVNPPYVNLLVSIGVSYFIFQAISYLIDIYLGIQEPERHMGIYALSLAFFPKLLQGPIERAGFLLPQIRLPFTYDRSALSSAIALFTWGLFKKVVLANHLTLYTDNVFNNVHDWNGLPLLIATYAYALQIYFDFSGYTDMARGTARIFGINLTENFNSPYLATSIADFWRRWHISFSRWILDYIFKPLQMSWRDQGKFGTASALIVTFLISGIWHGSSWGFVIWGLLHGCFLAIAVYYQPYKKRLYKWLGIEEGRFIKAWQVFITFHLVCFTWIFFRANSIYDGIYIITSIMRDVRFNVQQVYSSMVPFTINNNSISHCMVMVLLLFYYIKYKKSSNAETPYLILLLNLFLIVFLGKFTASSFIYMNF